MQRVECLSLLLFTTLGFLRVHKKAYAHPAPVPDTQEPAESSGAAAS